MEGISQTDINKHLFNKLDTIDKKLDELLREISLRKRDRILEAISFDPSIKLDRGKISLENEVST